MMKKMLATKKLMKHVFLGMFFIMFFLGEAAALGITPGRTTINFEPGLKKEISFSVINSEHKDMAVLLTVRGELNQSVVLNEVYTEFSSREETKTLTYEISLPENFEKPGLHEAEIVALELPKDFRTKGTFVGATLAVISQVHVYAPYPGKYLETEVNIIPGEETTFFVPVISRGKLDIASVKAIVDVSSGNEKIATLETGETDLKSLERKELFAKWKSTVPPGSYKAKVSVFYDNQVAYAEKEFTLGELALSLLDVYVKDFQLGGIAKFTALVENTWGKKLEDVFLNIVVYNQEGEVMADVKSATYALPALSKSEMVAYWDTAGVKEGTYDGKILLNYGKITERPVKIKVSSDEILIIGTTGKVITKGGGRLSVQNLLIGAVFFLIAVNIAWFVVIRRMLKKKEAKRERGVEHAR